ncbi:rhomboid family intramembrane serine protease [Acidobacteriota bacterium]
MFIPLKDDNPTSRFPIVTVVFIALNAVIFFLQLVSPEGLQFYVYKMGTIPYEITHFKSLPLVIGQTAEQIPRLTPALTLIVSMFLHGDIFHLLFNMLYLWIFGNNVEDFLGSFRFILFYLVAGVGASLTHIIFNANSQVPMIGASGAIAGVLGAYLILYPKARVMTFMFLFIFIRIVPIPAAFVLGFWFFMQLLNVGAGGGVAWFAHIGGFLIGIGLIKLITKKRPKVWIH